MASKDKHRLSYMFLNSNFAQSAAVVYCCTLVASFRHFSFLATSQVGPSSIAEKNGAKMRRHQHKGNNHCSSIFSYFETLLRSWKSLGGDHCQILSQALMTFANIANNVKKHLKTFQDFVKLVIIWSNLVKSHFIKSDAWEATVSAMSEMIWYHQLLKCMNYCQAGDYVTNQTDRVCSNFGNA